MSYLILNIKIFMYIVICLKFIIVNVLNKVKKMRIFMLVSCLTSILYV